MCADAGTSRAEGDDGGSTPSLIHEIAFFGVPAQLLCHPPDALPPRSTLLSGSRALETAVASTPICRRENCRFGKALRAGDFSPAREVQFCICDSRWATPPKNRGGRRGKGTFSGGSGESNRTRIPAR